MIFFGLYLLSALVGLGVVLYFVLRKIFPDQNPMWMLSQFMIYWILGGAFLPIFYAKTSGNGCKTALVNAH